MSPQIVVLKIKDKLLPQNNLTIEIGKGTSRLSEAPNDLEIAISDLTPLLTGRLSPTRLWRHGKLRTDSWKNVSWGISKLPEKVKVLESIFPPFITHNAI